MSLLVNLALTEAVIFAILLLVGGIMGWIKKKSKTSAVAGFVCCVIICLAVWSSLTIDDFRFGLLIISLLSVSLFAFFFNRYLSTGRRLMPGGVTAVLSTVTFLLSLVALVFG